VLASDDLRAAARVWRERHVGYLVVVEPATLERARRPVGVLTDRDLVVGVLARDADPHELRVQDVMTPNPVTVRLGDSIAFALQEMRRLGVRRLPIVGDIDELVGVISIDDILALLAGQLGNIAGSIRAEQRFEQETRT
jgi:CBS domain-containing protein